MNLQKQINGDLRKSIISNDEIEKDILKVIVGELQRQPSKELSDNDVIRVLKQLKKEEEETLKVIGESSSVYLEILKKYIPNEPSIEEIIEWIKLNVDFSSLKNKMQAIGMVTKQYGSLVDGNVVKKIIIENF